MMCLVCLRRAMYASDCRVHTVGLHNQRLGVLKQSPRSWPLEGHSQWYLASITLGLARTYSNFFPNVLTEPGVILAEVHHNRP